jgi:hypothetical protein
MSTTDLRQAIGLCPFATLLVSVGMILLGYLGYTNALTAHAVLFTAFFIAASLKMMLGGRRAMNEIAIYTGRR